MQGIQRKVVQAVLYEAIALALVTPLLSWAFDRSWYSSGGLAVLLSSLALVWNVVFNQLFEYWEARQFHRARSFNRRLLHALGFEGGLLVLLTPVIAAWLDISMWTSFLTNAGLFVFFFGYALGFQWAFDRIFNVPASAAV